MELVRICHMMLLTSSDSTACETGRYADTQKLPQCKLCGMLLIPFVCDAVVDPGFFGNVTGLTVCSKCSTGEFQDASGQPACKLCPPGQFSSATGQVRCVECLPGWCFAALRLLSRCSTGSYSVVNGSQDCQPCPEGSSQPSIGQTSCLACVPGRAIGVTRQVKCDACDCEDYQLEGALTVACSWLLQ